MVIVKILSTISINGCWSFSETFFIGNSLNFKTPISTPQPTPSQITISEARSAYDFLIDELVKFNNELDFRINDLRKVIQANYSDSSSIPGGYELSRNFELKINDYITKWESIKQYNNNALIKLKVSTSVEEYVETAKATGTMLLINRTQYNSDATRILQLVEQWVYDMKFLLIEITGRQIDYLLANPPTPKPTTGQQGSPGQSVPLNLPPPEPEICQQIRDDPDYSKSSKQTKLNYYGCY